MQPQAKEHQQSPEAGKDRDPGALEGIALTTPRRWACAFLFLGVTQLMVICYSSQRKLASPPWCIRGRKITPTHCLSRGVGGSARPKGSPRGPEPCYQWPL